MRTPSLRLRVVASGLAVVALLLVVVGTFVYLLLQQQLDQNLEDVLAARADLARELATLEDPPAAAERLQALGVPATVTGPDGVVHRSEPATPRFQTGPPGPLAEVPHARASTTVALASGTQVEVFATRAGVDATLRRVLTLITVGSALALVAAVLLLRRAATFSMAPLDHVVTTADRTAAGRTGERLEPDAPHTELGRMAVAYDRMLDHLEAALAATQDAEERTRRFVDDAAHQLRTPLASIRGSVEALLQESDPRVRDRLMTNLVRETARSNRLLTALLTLARLDQGQPVDLAPTDLVELCREEIERTRSLTAELTVTYEPSDGATGTWLADARGTQEILANLLDNARRHARRHVRVEVERVTTRDGGAVIELRVRDDGAGVPQEARGIVFDRFTTLDGRGGSGLGLAIARTLARAQGGDLVHRDDVFVLRLPARPADGSGRT